MKKVIMDVMNETAEIKIETNGFTGSSCVKETQFLKDALGEEMEKELKPIYYANEKKGFLPLCG